MNSAGAQPRQGRREAILDQASRRLNSAGVSFGAMADIAGALGITRSALYGYARDREDLIFQCYRRGCDIMQERFAAAAAAHDDPFDVIGGFIGNVLDPQQPEAAALSELGCLRPDQQRAIEDRREALLAEVGHTLVEGQARGLMREFDPRVAARALLSLVYWLKLAPRWLDEEADLPRERLQSAARRLLFEGAAAEPAAVPEGFIDLASLTPQPSDVFDRKAMAAVKLDRMLAAASRLFNQRGVDTTSVDEIAAELGVTKRTIYNHFPDKPALVLACAMRGYRIFTEVGGQAAQWPGRRAEALGAALHASVLCSFRAELSPLRVFSGLPGLAEDRVELRGRAGAGLRRAYGEIIQQGVAEGSLRHVELHATLVAMTGVSSWVGASSDLDPEHVALEIAQLLLHGLKASG